MNYKMKEFKNIHAGIDFMNEGDHILVTIITNTFNDEFMFVYNERVFIK